MEQKTPPPSDDFAPLSLLISRIRAQRVISFSEIARYTRMVATAKWGLAFLALAMVLLLIVLPMTVPKEAAMRLAFSHVSASGSERPVMLNPRFEGIDESNQPFTVLAKQASQRDDRLVDLDTLQADLGLSGGNKWLNMTAEKGVYDREIKYLWLRGNVSLFFDDGYEAHTQECDIDIGKTMAYGRTELNAQGPMGTLRADQFRIDQQQKRAFFTGNVRVVLYLNGKQ